MDVRNFSFILPRRSTLLTLPRLWNVWPLSPPQTIRDTSCARASNAAAFST